MSRAFIFLLMLGALIGLGYLLIKKGAIQAIARICYVPKSRDEAPGEESYLNTILSRQVDSLHVIKHLRSLQVYHSGKLLKIYKVSLGGAPIGHKHFQGDEKTPEGLYYIDGKNPNSCCHKNLGISYPNDADRVYAEKAGRPTGGDIKIHGLPNGQGYIGKAHLLHDWTKGCIGVTDEEIDELYSHVIIGAPIRIVP